MKTQSTATTRKLQKLFQLAQELRKRQSFSVSRLAVVKGFCHDHKAAVQFALHLLTIAPPADKPNHRRLIGKVRAGIKRYLKNYRKKPPEKLSELLWSLQRINNQYRRIKWGTVREIESNEALLAEKALRCVLYPEESASWGYQSACQFAKRHDYRYGGGLTPKSAPMVEAIAEFWSRYYLPKTV